MPNPISPYRTMTDNILRGLTSELSVARKGIPFKLTSAEARRGVLTLILEANGGLLDIAMEESHLKWVGVTEGEAEVISVLPDESKIHALLVGGRVPKVGQTVWVNPPEYLKPLLNLWSSESPVESALTWYGQLGKQVCGDGIIPDHSDFPALRSQQVAAFDLLASPVSFLWGPPGTGKTYTLGRMIGAYVTQTSGRVLLLSTTNVAVDEAIDSVYSAVEESTCAAATPRCYRFGSRFSPNRFADAREQLIPVINAELIRRYREHMVRIPDPNKVDNYRAWRERLDELRTQIRNENRSFIRSARVAAMTASYAAFEYESLRISGAWDLIVFDEASQVSKAHALMLAGLGRRTLFAGDPMQLSPIVQSDDEHAMNWVGNSPFQYMDRSNSSKCMLDEQSRMAPDICRVVSELFYEGQLRVANDVDEQWWIERRLDIDPVLDTRAVSLLRTPYEAHSDPKSRRYVCPKSASLVVRLAALLLKTIAAEDLLILTSYRVQRTEIINQLKRAGLPTSMVSTIHRAQGSERLVVIIDPVRPSAKFLNGEEGNRMLNVAISRAKARLFLIMQPDYHRNPTTKRMAELVPPVDLEASPLLQPEPDKPTLAAPQKKQHDPLIITLANDANVFSLEEKFRFALYSALSWKFKSTSEKKWAIDRVAHNPRYATLTWAARSQIINEVTSADS
jgi:DNA replication ATP-dependent helicase Dna2